MARHYRPGDIKWVAYPDGYARVEIVARVATFNRFSRKAEAIRRQLRVEGAA